MRTRVVKKPVKFTRLGWNGFAVDYDDLANVLYLRLGDGKSERQVKKGHGVIFDLDVDGKLLGIEVIR